jgi:integrating conjugative element membrane protein (TIGR03745 family)
MIRRPGGSGRWAVLAGALAGLAWIAPAWAALPTPPLPGGMTGGSDNWLAMLQGYAKEGGTLLGLLFSLGGFFWTGWIALAELNEVRGGRKEMGGAILSAVLGAVVFLWISYLLLRAKDVL